MLLIGIILGITASVCSNFGNIQQKYALNHEITNNNYFTNKRWLCGLFLTILGSILDLVALSNISQSILGPLSAFGLISNIIFSRWYLKEQINKNHLIATSLIITGTIIIVLFGDHSHTIYTLQAIKELFIRPTFLIYFGVCIILLTYVYFLTLKMNTQFEEFTNFPENIEIMLTYLDNKSFHPILLCGLSGIFGGYSILFGKICSELVSSSIQLKYIQFFDPFIGVKDPRRDRGPLKDLL